MNLFRALRRRTDQDDPNDYHVLSFAQEGEDRLLLRLLEGSPPGFYVDVGAHHPQRFSNTHAFYLRGWRGLNIDPAPGTKALFDRLRPRDINLELAVGPGRPRTYFQFAESALNSLDADLANERRRQGHAPLVQTEIATFPLAQILDRYLPADTAIDFLNVDVEGLDLEVLRSNTWHKYRPRLVLAEDRHLESLFQIGDAPIVRYLLAQGYVPVAKTLNTGVFERRES